MSKVLNVANYPIDLDDGRTIAPGEEAEDVQLQNPHNANLVGQGHIVEVEEPPKKPKRPAPDDATEQDKN